MRPCVATQLLLGLALGAGSSSVALGQAQLQVRQQAIVGGDVSEDAASATALIGDCDATLVGADLLLTAAHCVEKTPTEAWFGPSREQAYLSVSIEACTAHPEYPSKPGTDIAYCTLADRVTEIDPVDLPSSCDEDPAQQQGAWLVLRGHGYVTVARQEARIEREVAVLIQTLQADGRELVVGDRSHGACHGDSGGSGLSVAEDGSLTLIGVISHRGPTNDPYAAENCASTTIVTRVAPHLAWLQAETGAVLRASCSAAPQAATNSTLPVFMPDADDPFAAAETTPRPPPAPPTTQTSPAVGCAVSHAPPRSALFEAWPWVALLTLAQRRARRRPSRTALHP
jgi:hypothetical protein